MPPPGFAPGLQAFSISPVVFRRLSVKESWFLTFERLVSLATRLRGHVFVNFQIFLNVYARDIKSQPKKLSENSPARIRTWVLWARAKDP